MMFSDYVRAVGAILGLPLSAFFAVLPLILILGALISGLSSFLRDVHPLLLAIAGFIAYALATELWMRARPPLDALAFVPLFFISKEGYRRLVGNG